MTGLALSLLAGFGVTLTVSVLLVLTQSWHGRYSFDDTNGVQKLHTNPTPRVGGLAVLAGLLTASFLDDGTANALLAPAIWAGLPALAFGLAEDITKRVGVAARLMATMGSGFLAWWITGIAMQDTGFSPLDWLLQYVPLAVLFTAFAVGGVANAVNIVDGFNGLAAGIVAIMLACLGYIGNQTGDIAVLGYTLIVGSVALGFVAANWPFGRIFLGDGGAYFLGFLVAWLAVVLPMRSEDVNAWATIMACAYPVMEVGFSVRRKRNRRARGHNPGKPDTLHMHHLVHRRIVCKLFPQASKRAQNALTSPIIWAMAAVPAIWAALFFDNPGLLAAGLFGSAMLYSSVYARLSQFGWCFRPLTLLPKSMRSAA